MRPSRSLVSARSPISDEGITRTRSAPSASRTRSASSGRPTEPVAISCSASDQVGVAFPLTDRISSPACNSARAAGVSGAIAPISGRTPVSPSVSTSQKATIANRKLKAGPAATMAVRRHSGWRLNARCSSPGGTGPSCSSSILT